MKPLRTRLSLGFALLATLGGNAAWADSWLDNAPDVRVDLARGAPLVTHVIVPLCNNAQINCGAGKLGDPSDLDRNLYWGAVFGIAKYFERKSSLYEKWRDEGANGPRLTRIIYRRVVQGSGLGVGAQVEHLVIADAWHGDSIDDAVRTFFQAATQGESIEIKDKGTLRVHSIIYAGHNRLLDGLKLPSVAVSNEGITSFVLGCRTQSGFEKQLLESGAIAALTTRDYMAPEGYLVDSISQSLAAGLGFKAIRNQTIDTATSMWNLPRNDVSWIFAHVKQREP